jgi:hypothetical protein
MLSGPAAPADKVHAQNSEASAAGISATLASIRN